MIRVKPLLIRPQILPTTPPIVLRMHLNVQLAFRS